MRTLEESFIAHSKSFLAGDFTAVLRNFDLPVAIYAEDKIVVCTTIDDLVAAMTQYHGLLLENGAASVDVDILAVPLMRGPTGTIWIEKTYRGADGHVVDTCQLRYFFRRVGGQARICMVEYQKLPFAERMRELDIYRAA